MTSRQRRAAERAMRDMLKLARQTTTTSPTLSAQALETAEGLRLQLEIGGAA